MNPFTFQTCPNIVFAPGAAARIGEVVRETGARRVLLVTDAGVRGAGLTRGAEAALAEAGVALSMFDGVLADPPAAVVEAAAATARAEGVDLVLAIGGGSALDTAKLVAYLARSGEALETLYRRRRREGAAPAAGAGADDVGHRVRGDADRHRDDAHRREEGRGVAPPPARLGRSSTPR